MHSGESSSSKQFIVIRLIYLHLRLCVFEYKACIARSPCKVEKQALRSIGYLNF